jgi:exopolysaccharide biosynthesis polyprenyl glycosylphosphotransferase
MMLMTMCIALKTPRYSGLVLFTVAAETGFAICFSRFVARAWFHYAVREGMYAQNIAIVGWPDAAILLAQRLKKAGSPSECRIVGYFSLVPNAGTLTVGGGMALQVLGGLQDLEDVLLNVAIQRIIVVLPEADNHWLSRVIRTCDYFRITIEILPEAVLTACLRDLVPLASKELTGIPSLTLSSPDAESDWLYVKRVLDVFVSGTLLIVLAPVFLLVACAIKLTTPHLPVFYPWRVVGSRGRRFTGYKFTTMVADAEARREELAALNEMTGPVFKIANDPRVTPLGKFLRKYSVNELPQLWSVFKGDMSLVGPRPAAPCELEGYEPWQKRKLSAQPGITCLWQVRGRNRISNFDEWVRMDLEYIRNRSLWIDLKILARTAWVVVRGSGC